MNIPNFTQAARKYAIALALILVLLAVAEFAAQMQGFTPTYVEYDWMGGSRCA